MSEEMANTGAEIRHWPLQLRLRRSTHRRGLWEVDNWSLVALSSDRHPLSDPQQAQSLMMQLEVQEPPCQDYLWKGLSLRLYRDERPAYRFNLGSEAPQLFVVCNEEDALMRPMLITASQDAAAAYMDGGEEDVFSVAMPMAIQCWIEAFIARHGEPDLQAGKGRRRNHGRKKRDGSKPGDMKSGRAATATDAEAGCEHSAGSATELR